MNDGNSAVYSLQRVEEVKNHPLKGCRILYLGSSVTRGYAAEGVSFADYISRRCGTKCVKEAVDGTTLVAGEGSYVQRLTELEGRDGFDLLVCQLSTNDASKNKPLGSPTLTDRPDTGTICGAIEFITMYARSRFNCGVVFYTNPYYENEKYTESVLSLRAIADIYGIDVIDLYNDAEFNGISPQQRKLYMADEIHPTMAGYLEWLTPKIESRLIEIYLSSKQKNNLQRG